MRKKYIEYLRVLSMFAVIAIHVCIIHLIMGVCLLKHCIYQ